jgi:hypothetical protein
MEGFFCRAWATADRAKETASPITVDMTVAVMAPAVVARKAAVKISGGKFLDPPSAPGLQHRE